MFLPKKKKKEENRATSFEQILVTNKTAGIFLGKWKQTENGITEAATNCKNKLRFVSIIQGLHGYTIHAPAMGRAWEEWLLQISGVVHISQVARRRRRSRSRRLYNLHLILSRWFLLCETLAVIQTPYSSPRARDSQPPDHPIQSKPKPNQRTIEPIEALDYHMSYVHTYIQACVVIKISSTMALWP